MTNGQGKITLTVLILIVTLLVISSIIEKVEAEPLDTYHSRWVEVRAEATEDAADFASALALATSEGDFDNKPDGAYRIKSHQSIHTSEGGGWLFTIGGGIDDNDTGSFTVVGWAKANGMAQVICHGDVRLGTMDVVKYPGVFASSTKFWCDYINVDDTTLWPGGVGVFSNANNEIGMIAFDPVGLEWVQFFFYDADGSGTEMTNISVYGRPY